MRAQIPKNKTIKQLPRWLTNKVLNEIVLPTVGGIVTAAAKEFFVKRDHLKEIDELRR